MKNPTVHCWATSDMGVCMLADGHVGHHIYTPNEDVVIEPVAVREKTGRRFLRGMKRAAVTAGLSLAVLSFSAGDAMARCGHGRLLGRWRDREHRLHLLHRR